jgi:hypothetical protein
MFVTQNQSKEIFTIIYTKTFSILCVKKKKRKKKKKGWGKLTDSAFHPPSNTYSTGS